MKLLLLIALFLFTNLAFSETYFIHGHDSQVRKYLQDNKVSFHSVYTNTEFRLIKKLNPSYSNPIKINATEVLIKKINTEFEGLTIEPLIKLHAMTNDEFYYLQWGLSNIGQDLKISTSDIDTKIIKGIAGNDIGLPLTEQSASKTVVAVLDSGVDLNHPDLKGQIYQSRIECEAEVKYQLCLKDKDNQNCHAKWADYDGDQNGYPRDCYGYNVAAPKKDYQKLPGNNKVDDYIGHGTHVAGIIAAKKNKVGVRGVSEQVKILPVKVSGQEGGLDIGTDIFAKGILYALNTPAKVINLSFGWELKEDSKLVRDMIDLAHSRGLLLVAAAGNSFHDAPTYPCAYDNVICVGAYTVNGELASFSNFGQSIDLLAPGEQILSTWPTHMRSYFFFQAKGYEYQDGTSMAAPFVSAALARLINSGKSPSEAKRSLLQSATPTEQSYIRYGKVNLAAALKDKSKKLLNIKTKNFLLTNINDLKFQFKIENQGDVLRNLKISLVHSSSKLQQKNYFIKKLIPNQEFTLKSQFINNPFNGSPYTDLTLIITADDFELKRTIQIEAINIISETQKSDFFNSFPILNETKLDLKEHLKSSYFRTTEVYLKLSHQDVIAIQEKEHTKFILLKNNGSYYQVASNARFIQGNGHIFAKNLKVDLNNDGTEEYILFVYKKNNDGYQPEFLIFDQNFRPLKTENFGLGIPKNSVLGINLTWHADQHDLYKPLWIQRSFDPEYKEPELPWDLSEPNIRKNRLLTLKNNQLTNIDIGCEPLEFLNINHYEIHKDNLEVLCFTNKSFFREYEKISLKNSIVVKRKKIGLEHYFSFEQAETLIDPLTKNKVFYKIENDYLSFTNLDSLEDLKTPNLQKLLFIDSSTKSNIAYTTPYFLNIKMNKVQTRILKRANNSNNDSFFPFKIQNKQSVALFRPSNKTLGLSSDLILIDTVNESIQYNPKYRFVFLENISEIGLRVAKWGQKDTILMLNRDKLELLELKTSKELLD